MPIVSIIIPIYGVEAFIAATLQSVLDQTFQDFEVILVDDASPDRSVEICQQFTDPRLRIVRQENRGLAGARNTGIRHAQGELLAFLDGDDLWLPEKLARQVQHLQNHPEVGVSFCPSLLIDEDGQLTGDRLMPPLTNITPQALLRGNPIGNGSAPVVRRAALEAIQFTPPGEEKSQTPEGKKRAKPRSILTNSSGVPKIMTAGCGSPSKPPGKLRALRSRSFCTGSTPPVYRPTYTTNWPQFNR